MVHNDILDVDLSTLQPIPDRLDRLASRARNWLSLQEKPNAEKRVALICYNYPPGEEHLFSAAFLDAFASLPNILRTLKKSRICHGGAHR